MKRTSDFDFSNDEVDKSNDYIDRKNITSSDFFNASPRKRASKGKNIWYDNLVEFEYLRFLNHTMFKDEVLEEFMQRAEDLEAIAAPSAPKDKSK